MEKTIKIKINQPVLERLVEEFGEDFLSHQCRKITLYGAEKEILSAFEERMKIYLQQSGKRVPINFGEGDSYRIDVGFFLRAGYFKGINKDISSFLPTA